MKTENINHWIFDKSFGTAKCPYCYKTFQKNNFRHIYCEPYCQKQAKNVRVARRKAPDIPGRY